MKIQGTEVIILGAGISQQGELHSGLTETERGNLVLDWLQLAFQDLNPAIQFIGGYKIDEIEKVYPHFSYTINTDWKNTSAAGSLFCADFPDESEFYVTYSDILYRKSLVNKMNAQEGDVVVAVDTNWKERYTRRSQEDINRSEKVYYHSDTITSLGIDLDSDFANAEFIGLVRFSGRALILLKQLKKQNSEHLKKAKLSVLIEWLRLNGCSIKLVDVAGDWAEMDDPRDLAHFILGTKAQTLERLASAVKESTILDQYTFSVEVWEKDRNKIIEGIMKTFPNDRLVARSSALSEDSFSSANAGAYDSVLNIDNTQFSAIEEAILNVICSYSDKNLNNQVLVQPMVTEVKMSGVGFTRTLSHGAPYYVLNYDDKSGSTESITSGSSEDHKTFILRRDKLDSLHGISQEIIQLCKAFREIEQLVNYDSLDIEFAIDKNSKVYILQVRPIAVDHSDWHATDEELLQFIGKAEQQFHTLNQKSPDVVGTAAVFGVMPDWNPAEIIGINPGRLASSLYQEIIMNDIWSTQRFEYGYRDARPVPLLLNFATHPYVDVRASFNSFVPASLNQGLAERLVEYYLQFLKENPVFHDKVEFEVVPTCFDLDFAKWDNRLSDEGFSAEEIRQLKEALLEITQNAIFSNEHYFKQIEILLQKYQETEVSELESIDKAIYLLDDVKRYGTLPFSHLARSAFVAVSLLKSAAQIGILSNEAKDDFLSTIHTVSQEFTDSIQELSQGKIDTEAFLEKYGHIRPGTYDITSKSYKEAPEYYISPLLNNAADSQIGSKESGTIWNVEKDKFFQACRAAGIQASPQELESFMRGAIEGREYAKFHFSRNLSSALDHLIEFGNTAGISRAELSHITWNELVSAKELSANSDGLGEHLKYLSQIGAKWKQYGSSIELPPLITSITDFWWFYLPEAQANFIGSGQISSECIDLAENSAEELDLERKIVMIPRADPGYEWLFGRKIGGLITMYGGANSHMAIRAAEFNLPAAIGVGEKEYKRICGARILGLNAGNRKIDIIQ